jgi:C4-dicarboxylate transporter DctM subunit
VVFIAGNAIAFSWVLLIHQGPQQVAELLGRVSDSPIVILALINVVMIALHVFLEGASTVVAVVPVFLPVLARLHVDFVYFGIIVMLNSAAGLLMPPIGLCLYISCAMSGERIEVVARAVLPFVLAILVDIAVLLLFPGITQLLPRLLMR